MAEEAQEAADDNHNWIIPMQVLIDSLNHREVQSCSISIVSDRLRNLKEEAYTPQVVSIGALTNGTRRNRQWVKQLKLQYTEFLLGRTGMLEERAFRIRNFNKAMHDLDNIVRACYGGKIDIEPHDLANIMFVDGSFVLEFLLRFQRYSRDQNRWHDDNFEPIFTNDKTLNSVLNDLTILENQIPFVVLKNLYRGVFPSESTIENNHHVAELALSALRYGQVTQVPRSGVAHLLHLIHLSYVNPEEDNQLKIACQQLRRSAKRLQEVGVSIQAEHSDRNDNSSFLNKFDFNITFRHGILIIPPLHIKETTETSWRNLIAWEQSRIGVKSKFTSYALFFQGLICCEQDIELLLESNVIVNRLGISNEDLLTMFRTIADGAEHMDLSYSKLCDDLNKYRPAKPFRQLLRIMWNTCKSIVRAIRYLWKIYLSLPTLWKVVVALVSAAGLALSIAQTYYSAQGQNKIQPPGK